MSNLQHRQTKIQDKRKQTPWREFVMEICSWKGLNIHKKDNKITLYAGRVGEHLPDALFEERRNNPDNGVIDGVGFFDSLTGLLGRKSLPGLNHYGGLEDCDYTSTSYGSKSCYLSFNLSSNENVLYSISTKDNSKNIINGLMIYDNSENIYQSSFVAKGYNVFYSKYIVDCNNIYHCSNLIGCSECINCDQQENKQYMINNIQYSKDEYFVLKRDLILGKSFNSILVDPINYASNNVEGRFILKSQDITFGVGVMSVSGGSNLLLTGSDCDNQNLYDLGFAGAGGCKEVYGGIDVAKSNHIYNSVGILNCSSIFYSYYLESCSFCLGCIGLKNKSYCILNKQYSKEEWYQKVDEIFGQMDKTPSNSPLSRGGSQLGEFFPATMNPFYFNDTAAYLIDPSFTKEEVTAAGYLWRDEAIKVDIPEDAKVVSSSELMNYEGFDDQGNRTINADILKCVIQDEQGNYYRIIPMEYKFLMKHGLPLPRKHWLERMKENFRIN